MGATQMSRKKRKSEDTNINIETHAAITFVKQEEFLQTPTKNIDFRTLNWLQLIYLINWPNRNMVNASHSHFSQCIDSGRVLYRYCVDIVCLSCMWIFHVAEDRSKINRFSYSSTEIEFFSAFSDCCKSFQFPKLNALALISINLSEMCQKSFSGESWNVRDFHSENR